MEPAPGFIRRSLHHFVRSTTRRLDTWSETVDRAIDAHPTIIIGIALGFARLVIGVLFEAHAMTPKSASSQSPPGE
jgi:hypothetical protein